MVLLLAFPLILKLWLGASRGRRVSRSVGGLVFDSKFRTKLKIYRKVKGLVQNSQKGYFLAPARLIVAAWSVGW